MLGFHHLGTFLLFVSFILLLIESSQFPDRKVTLGALGACIVRKFASDSCSPAHVGYDPSDYIQDSLPRFFRGVDIGDVSTSALVLHPIAAGLAFFAFLIAAVSHRLGFIFAALVAGVVWVVVLALVIVDITTFHHVRQQVSDFAALSSTYGAGFCTIVAFILLFFGALATCFSCVSARRRTKDVQDA